MWFRKRQDSDFHAEIESHIRLETDRLIAEGMPPSDAEAAARRAFGNMGNARERFYESHRWMWWDELRRNLQYGLRSLAKTPSFTAAAALTIALGVGTNTAVFSLVDTVVLRYLPVHDPSALVFVRTADNAGSRSGPPYRVFDRLREQVSAFTGMAAFATDELRVEIDGRPEPVNGQVASVDYFVLLGVKTSLGRLMDASGQNPDPPIAVISDRYWQGAAPLSRVRAQYTDATEGPRPAHRPRRVPTGYSSIGLLASIARLRFTGTPRLSPTLLLSRRNRTFLLCRE